MLENAFSHPLVSKKNAPADEVYYISCMPYSPGVPFFMESIGVTNPNPDYRIERFRQGVGRFGIFVFEYVLEGRGYVECDGIRYTVEAGDFYFLGRNASHIYYTDRSAPYKKIWFNARGRLIDKLLEAYGITSQVVICRMDVLPICEEIRQMYLSGGAAHFAERNYRASLKVTELIGKMDRHLRDSVDKVDLPMRVKIYIDNSWDFSMTVERLAERFHLNSNYVTSVIKQKYGVKPKQYMLSRKIDCAKELLADPNCEIKEIAGTLSFSSVYHFSNTFKKITGETPSAYRRRVSEEAD